MRKRRRREGVRENSQTLSSMKMIHLQLIYPLNKGKRPEYPNEKSAKEIGPTILSGILEKLEEC
jgi:hypothetical protein